VSGNQSAGEKSLAIIEAGRVIDQMKSSENKIDVALIAMHGKFGEDGTVQGLLESVGIPCVIKPADSGSSVGVSMVKKPEDLQGAIESAFFNSNIIIAQDFIVGREVTCGVLDFGEEWKKKL